MPLPIADFNQRSAAQVVVDKDGLPLRAFPDSQGVWRYPVELSAVSPLYLEALINYEDRYFYQHFGVNPLAVIRAIGQWIKYGELVSGASTLTMQVARILKPHKKSFTGKLGQMFRALQLEWHYSKAEILTFYINYAPFGGPLEGVQAASYAYFDKPVSNLSYSEAALLAVLPQAPSRFRPDRYPQRAQDARNKLLSRLLTFNIWTEEIIQETMQEPVWATFNSRPVIAPLLTRRLVKQYPKQPLIQSTIDIQLQTKLELLVKDYIASKPIKTSAALLLLDNHDLSTRVYIGSADFLNDDRAGHVDIIKSVRSPGSTLKPFIYGMSIDQGMIHSESLLFDVPQSFNGYRPKNFTDSFSGPVSVTQALSRSLNMPAVQLLNEISTEFFYAGLKNAGLDIYLPRTAKPNLSLALGGGGVTLEQLVGVFSSLGRGGKAGEVRLTVQDELVEHKLLSQGSAWIIQHILSQASLNNHLRSSQIQNQQSIAYKTGTSYGFRDAWVLASNQKYTIGIWLGQPDGSFSENNSGRVSAVPLLRKVLSTLPKGWNVPVKQPWNVSRELICWPLGTKATAQFKDHCHKQRNAYLLADTAPPTINDPSSKIFSSGLLDVTIDINTQRRVLPNCFSKQTETKQIAVWPGILEPWIAQPYRRNNLLPAFSDKCNIIQSDNKLEITGVHHNAVIYPEAFSTEMPHVQLELAGSSGYNYWFINGVLLDSSEKKLNLPQLKPGKYEITVIDNSANFTELNFEVAL